MSNQIKGVNIKMDFEMQVFEEVSRNKIENDHMIASRTSRKITPQLKLAGKYINTITVQYGSNRQTWQ